MDHREDRTKRLFKDIFLVARLVTSIETSPLLPFSKVQQINFSISFILAISSLGNKATTTSSTPPQPKAATFILATLLQFWLIRPVPTPTSVLVSFRIQDK